MNLTEMQDRLLITAGDYCATLAKVELRPSKSKPGLQNIAISLDITLDSGRTAKVFDLLPPMHNDTDCTLVNDGVLWRYASYLKACDMQFDSNANLNTRMFCLELERALNTGVVFTASVSKEVSKEWGSRNKVSGVKPLSEAVQSVIKSQRHDSDTDAPAQPSALSNVGEQSDPSEDAQLS
jgi:hypothetical protein